MVRTVLHRIQLQQLLGLAIQAQAHLEVAGLEPGRADQPGQGLVALDQPALAEGQAAGRHLQRPQGGGEGAVQVGVHQGLHLRARQTQHHGVQVPGHGHLPGAPLGVHGHAAEQGQGTVGRGLGIRAGVQVRQLIGHPHIRGLQPVALQVHEEAGRGGGDMQAIDLGLFGHALAFQENPIERPMQPDPAAAGAVQGQIAQVGGPEPFPHRQPIGPVAHIHLVQVRGLVGPGEPQFPETLALALVQFDLRNAQHIPVDVHLGPEPVRLGPVPAGRLYLRLTLELQAIAGAPADPGLEPGRAGHAQGDPPAGRIPGADVPGRQHLGHMAGVGGQFGFPLQSGHPGDSGPPHGQTAGGMAVQLQFRQHQVHLGGLQPVVLKVQVQSAHPLAVPLEQTGAVDAQLPQSGQGPGLAAPPLGQAGLPGEAPHQVLEEARAGGTGQRRHGDVLGVHLQPAARSG